MLSILTEPHEVLRTVCKGVHIEELGSDDLLRQADQMTAVLLAEGALGLAANQVGFTNRVIVIRYHDNKAFMNSKVLVMVNPTIVNTNKKKVFSREGCLSVPGKFATVNRPKNALVQYWTEKGDEKRLKLTGIDALCVQHEIDHLNGVLMTDNAEKVENRR